MKTPVIFRTLALAAGLACVALAPCANGQALVSPSFTYQGQLMDGAMPANGAHEIAITLYNAQTGGTAIATFGTMQSPKLIAVEDGLFTTEIFFTQPNAFDGGDRWLEIRIRPQGAQNFTLLTPRQKITATPYALQTRGIHIRQEDGIIARIGPGTGQNEYTGIEFATGNTAGWSIAREPDNSLFIRAGMAFSGPKVVGMTAGPNVFEVFGRAKVSVLEITGGSDIAEPFDVAAADGIEIRPGMIVAIDRDQVGAMRLADQPYDTAVAGIISGAGGVNTGMILRQEGTIADGQYAVALTGRVWCYVDADAAGAIMPGDFITTSDTPGYGMKAADEARRSGAVIGKAMSSLESGQGLVLVLVNLQ